LIVGTFRINGGWLSPAWLEGREVIAVFEDRADPKPTYSMWLEWRGDQSVFIRDYRYVRYVTAEAALMPAPNALANAIGQFDAGESNGRGLR
jgi:RNA polymerase sigma-70 factor (ECF subfamily)